MYEDLKAVLKTLHETDYYTFDGNGFDPDTSNMAIEQYFSSMTNKERIKASMHIINHCSALQECLHKYLFTWLEMQEKTMQEELKRQKTELEQSKQPKMTFSPPEVVEISGKSKNTIYTHLKNGKLKGHQDSDGIWIIERIDLEEYLHRTDF